jgi:pyridoxine 5-phosphate synthase
MPAIHLSVNVNKVATLRNSRGGTEPRVLDAVRVCVDVGVAGVTVHPRADERHIRAADVHDIARFLETVPHIEFNIEGDPRSDLLNMVHEVHPHQCTLVPVVPGEITSQAGWQPGPQSDRLAATVAELRARRIRVSLFVDPEPQAVRFAASLGADRVELYTEPFARAYVLGSVDARHSFERYAAASLLAAELGLGVNAGHDLDLENLRLFRELPHLAEVSIGHALMSRALFVGLAVAVREYLAVLAGAPLVRGAS